MIRTNFQESNIILTPPEGMSEDESGGSYFAYKGTTETGVPLVITCWKPTIEEIETVMNGGRVWLILLGDKQPPAAITADSPFEEG